MRPVRDRAQRGELGDRCIHDLPAATREALLHLEKPGTRRRIDRA
jgi:hypothetical protein